MNSIKTNSPVNHVDRLRQQFALLGQDTFCKALGSDQVEQILHDEVGPYRERIYPPMVTLRLFIDQILSPDATCQDAVGRRLSQRAADNQSPCSLNRVALTVKPASVWHCVCPNVCANTWVKVWRDKPQGFEAGGLAPSKSSTPPPHQC